jgi:hypothetical protein
VLQILQQYALSWSRLPSVVRYRDAFATYSLDLASDLHFWHFTDPDMLAGLQDAGVLEFVIEPEEIAERRAEAKVERSTSRWSVRPPMIHL